MSILAKKLDNLEKMPYIDTRISKSRDGKWLIHKTIITDIRAVEKYERVIQETNGLMEEEFLLEKPVFDEDFVV